MKFNITINFEDNQPAAKTATGSGDYDYRIRADFDDEAALFVGKTIKLIDEQVAELKEQRRPKDEEGK